MIAITFHFGEHWKVRENTFLRLNILRWIWQLSEKYCSHICPVTFPMLIRADTFGGDSHNFSGCFNHIIILSGQTNKHGSPLQNRFAWNCFTTAKAHTFVNPPTKLKHAEKFTFSESSLLLLPWVRISSCCWNRPCLLFCLLWTQPILSLALSQLLWIHSILSLSFLCGVKVLCFLW